MGQLVFQATLGGQVNLVGPNTASTYNINVPAVAGTLVTTGDTGTVTNTMLAGSIANAKLTNSSVTIGSISVALGTTASSLAGLTDVSTSTLTASGAVTVSAGTANGVAYLNGSKVLTTGSALVFDGTNLGLGVTPSALVSGSKAFQVGALTSLLNNSNLGSSEIVNNAYQSGASSYTYLFSGNASLHRQVNGQHQWLTATSGTAGNPITFTQAMTLDSSGNLLVGQTAVGTQNLNSFSLNATLGVQAISHVSGSASGNPYMVFAYANTQIGSITQSGTTAVLYNVTSDQRLKENIIDAPEFGGIIDAIQVRSYDWKIDGNHQRAGFIAQELVKVAPEAVHQPVDPEEMMAVDYSKLVPMIVKEIQSLRKRLAAVGIA